MSTSQGLPPVSTGTGFLVLNHTFPLIKIAALTEYLWRGLMDPGAKGNLKGIGTWRPSVGINFSMMTFGSVRSAVSSSVILTSATRGNSILSRYVTVPLNSRRDFDGPVPRTRAKYPPAREAQATSNIIFAHRL